MTSISHRMNLRPGIVSFVFGLLASISSSVYAQKDSVDHFGLVVKMNPTTLLTPATPSMTFGIELLFPGFQKHGWSMEFDYGFRCDLDKMYPEQSGVNPYNVYEKSYSKYHVELHKYSKPRKKEWFTMYHGIEVLYFPYNYALRNATYATKDFNQYTFDYAHVSKDIWAADFKAGFITRFSPWFSFEGFAGLGVRQIHLTYYDFTNRQYNGTTPANVMPQEGKKYTLHFALGATFSYRFQW